MMRVIEALHKVYYCPLKANRLMNETDGQKHTYAYGAASPMDGKFDSLVLPQVNGQSMQVFIDEVSERCSEENILMVLDGASWHKSQGIKLPPNLKLHFVPSYSPELNPQEHVWDELREKHFHNKAFENMDAREEDLVKELQTLESNHQRVKSITGWEWIIKPNPNISRK